jgi:hypothetical protein
MLADLGGRSLRIMEKTAQYGQDNSLFPGLGADKIEAFLRLVNTAGLA